MAANFTTAKTDAAKRAQEAEIKATANKQLTRASPGSLGFGYFNVSAFQEKKEKHFKKRILVTYIYLLLIYDLRHQEHAIPGMDGTYQPIPAPLQTGPTYSNKYQAAHQLLKSILISGKHPWDLDLSENVRPRFANGVAMKYRRAFIYCASVTSSIDEVYNFVDNIIEANATLQYVSIFERIKSRPALYRLELYNLVINMFDAACSFAFSSGWDSHTDKRISNFKRQAQGEFVDEQKKLKKKKSETEIKTLISKAEEQRNKGKLILTQHLIDIAKMRSLAEINSAYDVNYWIDNINWLYEHVGQKPAGGWHSPIFTCNSIEVV